MAMLNTLHGPGCTCREWKTSGGDMEVYICPECEERGEEEEGEDG
jgi:hypothetical protein